jgi:hypothetical protein
VWAAELASTLPEIFNRLSDPALAPDTILALKKQARLRAKELFG